MTRKSPLVLSIGAALFLAGQALADLSQANAYFAEAEAYRTGVNQPRDLEKAIALYQRAAENGRKSAYYRLGQLHLALGETDQALTALETSAGYGSAGAAVLLAESHAVGAFGDKSDPALGIPILTELAQTPGETRASLVLAELYAEGLGVAKSPERALDYYGQAAAAGDARALRALGRVYLQGRIVDPDLDRAVALLRQSVDAGSQAAMMDLALALMENGQEAEALRVLDEAVDMNVDGAAAELANAHYRGHFGALSDKIKGARDLKMLAEAGDTRAARYALRHHERKSRRIRSLDLERVLAQLEASASDGDAFAAAVLSRSYRTLYWLIPNNREKHAALIGTYPHLFSADALLAEQIWATYDPTQHRASRQRAWELLDASEGEGFSDALLRLRAVEQRAYVYALQNELRTLGAYDGQTNGYANTRFINALLDYCKAEGLNDTCRHGPLGFSSSRLIAETLESKRKARQVN